MAYTVTAATTTKIAVTMASTRNDRSRMAKAGVDTGANMLGVAVVAAVTLMPYRRRSSGSGDRPGANRLSGDGDARDALVSGKRESKYRALRRVGLGPEPAPVRLDDRATDRQPHPHAVRL